MEEIDFCNNLIGEKRLAATLPGEEIKLENCHGVNTDIFEKSLITFSIWAEKAANAMMKHKSIRIVIDYNTDTAKTQFAVYTPIEDEKGDMKQE